MIEVDIALGALFVIFMLCLFGIFYEFYDDNWLQRVGLVMVAGTSVLMFRLILEEEIVSRVIFWFILGWLVFAVGVAMKVYKHRKRPSGVLHAKH